MAEITYGGRVLTHDGLEVSIRPRTFDWLCECGATEGGFATEFEAEDSARRHHHRKPLPKGWDE